MRGLYVSLVVCVLVCGAVLATEGLAKADAVELTLTNNVPAGTKPSLSVLAKENIGTITLEIDRLEDKKHFRVVAGPLTAGARAEMQVGDGKAMHAHWKGRLVVKSAGGEITNQITFESSVVPRNGSGLHVIYDRAHLDLDHGKLEVQVNAPAKSAVLSVVGDDGKEQAHVERSLSGERPNTWLAIEWKPSPQPVLRLELVVTSEGGETTMVKLIPWSVSIAHEEVIFPSGQSAIPPAEAAKLDASYAKIVAAVEKVRKNEPSLAVRVYVAGHTDTVGGSDDNRKLSQARARAIAAWFRDRGLPLPLFYAGFGEDQPKVKTADNTDEARNRRADYVVGVEEPASGRGKYAVLK